MTFLIIVQILAIVLQIKANLHVDSGESALVRICAKDNDYNFTIIKIGLYVHPMYVIAPGIEFFKAILNETTANITLLMGAKTLDCSSGQQRKVASISFHDEGVFHTTIIKIDDPFLPSANVTILRPDERTIRKYNSCFTYINAKILDPTGKAEILLTEMLNATETMLETIKQNSSLSQNLTSPEFDDYEDFKKFMRMWKANKKYTEIPNFIHEAVSCKFDNSPWNICLSENVEDQDNDPSPVVCDGIWVGVAYRSHQKDELLSLFRNPVDLFHPEE